MSILAIGVCPPVAPPEDAPKIFWPVGFAEGESSVIAVAENVAPVSGLITYGVRIPFAQTVKMANNVEQGLDWLIKGALPYLAKHILPRRPSFYAGNSLGGGTSMISSAGGECDALGVVSPLVCNKELGRTAIGRATAAGWRLAVKTALQYRHLGQDGVEMVLHGAVDDFRTMGVRAIAANRYAFSDRTEDMATEGLRTMIENGDPAAVFCPDEDLCFRTAGYDRLYGNLACNGVVMHAVPGPHAIMASDAGRVQAEIAAAWFAHQYAAGQGS